MIELIMKMIICLLIALALGFVIGWLLSKIVQSKKHIIESDKIYARLYEKDEELKKLNKTYEKKKESLLQLETENRELNSTLEEKSQLLEEKSDYALKLQQALNIAKNSAIENSSAKEYNQALVQQVNKFETLCKKRENEMTELEEVLVKAEVTIEEKEKLILQKEKDDSLAKAKAQLKMLEAKVEELTSKSKQDKAMILEQKKNLEESEKKFSLIPAPDEKKEKVISDYEKRIVALENELKLYTLKDKDDELIISKDQFTHIEEQLISYQKEINSLKEMNKSLVKEGDAIALLKSNSNASDVDDKDIVKLFRDTYKKITKS